VCDDPGIERVGLRQWPSCLGQITYLARVHHGNGQFGHGQGGNHGAWPASCRFEPDRRGLPLAEWRETLGHAYTIMGHTPARGFRTVGEVEVVFRDINAHKP